MARGTPARSVEIIAAGRSVARGQVCRIHGTPPAPKLGEFVHLAVHEPNDGVHLVFTKVVEGRHSRVGPSGSNHRYEFVAVRILSHQFRPREVWTCFPSGGILAVAESALRRKPDFALA